MWFFGKGKKTKSQVYCSMVFTVHPIGFSKEKFLKIFKELDMPIIDDNVSVLDGHSRVVWIYCPTSKKKAVLKKVRKLKCLDLQKKHGKNDLYKRGAHMGRAWIPNVGGVHGQELLDLVGKNTVWFQ